MTLGSRGLYLRVVGMLAMCLLVRNAAAIEQSIEPPINPPVQPPAETSSWDFDVAFGAALTSDYISRGITNSDSDFAIQGYIEPSIGWAYVNVWSSNVDYGAGFKGAEIDVAVGARPEFGPLSLDVGYVHYFYTPEELRVPITASSSSRRTIMSTICLLSARASSLRPT